MSLWSLITRLAPFALAGATLLYVDAKLKERARFADPSNWGEPFQGIDLLCAIGAQHEAE